MCLVPVEFSVDCIGSAALNFAFELEVLLGETHELSAELLLLLLQLVLLRFLFTLLALTLLELRQDIAQQSPIVFRNCLRLELLQTLFTRLDALEQTAKEVILGGVTLSKRTPVQGPDDAL